LYARQEWREDPDGAGREDYPGRRSQLNLDLI
jgi:hypothetical protein